MNVKQKKTVVFDKRTIALIDNNMRALGFSDFSKCVDWLCYQRLVKPIDLYRAKAKECNSKMQHFLRCVTDLEEQEQQQKNMSMCDRIKEVVYHA